MTYASMFHLLEPLLMDLYNARARAKTVDSAKVEQINSWIDTLKCNPTPKQFEEILTCAKEL